MAVPGPDNTGWYLNDRAGFRMGVEALEGGGGECVYLKSVMPRPKAGGFICKTVAAESYSGKRLRLSASIRTALPEGAGVQLWLRVDGPWKKKEGCFDNMFERRIRGVTDWGQYQVEVDVPADGENIVYGVLLDGTGQLWMRDLVLE
jgi:hypothetical protein